jgi:hypothetical protein
MNKEQIAIQVQKAAFMKIDGFMYRIDYHINEEEEQEVHYHDEDSGEEYISTFDELETYDIEFFSIEPIENSKVENG